VEPWLRNVQSCEGEEVVVLSSVLGSPLTAGLTHFMNRRLIRCDGVKVTNLVHLTKLIDESNGPSICFELDDDEIIALPLEEARKVTPEVLKANLIPAARCLPAG